MDSSFEETICRFAPLFRTLLYFNLALFGLVAVSFVFAAPGSPSFYITIITSCLLVLTTISIAGLLRWCDRKLPD